MSYQTWMEDAVSDAFRGVKGYRVEAYSGWRTRSAATTSFAPIGVMNHHTGAGGYDNLLNYMMRGSSISPLCNIATSRPQNGVVRITLCAAGRANHAGRGSWSWTGTNGGNYRTIGIENQNTGTQAWPQQQVEGIHILSAALIKAMGVGTTRLIDHKTYAPGRKVDRHSTNVSDTRRAVQRILAHGVEPEPEPVPPDEWEVFWMSLTDKEKARLKEFAGELAGSRGVDNGASFARQFLLFNREERNRLRDLLNAIDYMDSSPAGQGRALAALWREASARGWDTDFEAYRENRVYTPDDVKNKNTL